MWVIRNIFFCYIINYEVIIIVSYAPFWKTIKRMHLTQYDLIKKHHVSSGCLDRMRQNKNITIYTLHEICMKLDCEITDVVEFIKK